MRDKCIWYEFSRSERAKSLDKTGTLELVSSSYIKSGCFSCDGTRHNENECHRYKSPEEDK